MDLDNILVMENISKSFPSVKALDNVSLTIRKGSVHALVGENGAGKSTLMRVLIGLYGKDSGTIIFNGQEVEIPDTASALKMGISMIHQELSPVPNMTVAENIFLGREPLTKFRLIDKHKMLKDTRDLLKKLKINLDANTMMKDISIANTQMIEIAKAISYDSSLIIMDEPTSAITDREIENLFGIIHSLTERGVAIIFITHKIDEVFKIADEITVFRDGQYIATVNSNAITKNELIAMMVGRELTNVFPKSDAKIKEVVLEVRNLSRKGKVNNVSFVLKRGEILGLAGLMGAGRTEIIEGVFGIEKIDSGEIYIKGQRVSIKNPQDAKRHGMALLTEDRRQAGILSVLPVRDNMVVASLTNFLRFGLLQPRMIDEVCNNEKQKLDIKTPSMNQLIKLLSGGNQQKVLVSRWLLTSPDILILDEPTRGIDVGAKAEIHHLMSKLAQEGKAIIMISSELPEILGMSDRILVMYEGNMTGEFSRAEANQESIMLAATGTVKLAGG